MVRVQRFGVRDVVGKSEQTVSSLTKLSGGDGCIVERNEYVQRNPTSKRGVRGCSLNETAQRFDGHSSWHRVVSNTRCRMALQRGNEQYSRESIPWLKVPKSPRTSEVIL
jgi:hypothetical protein